MSRCRGWDREARVSRHTMSSSPAGAVVPVTEDAAREAEEHKQRANQYIKEKKFALAVENYDLAIGVNPNNHVYYGNRALAHIRLENYGSAIVDADKCIELNPGYVKAYYRRADANLALNKIKLALLDFRRASKYAPKDPDLRRKLQQCEKAVKVMQFEKALATPQEEVVPAYSKVVLEDMVVEEGFTGSRMAKDAEGKDVVTLDFVLSMIEDFKAGRKLHRRYAYSIILGALEIFKELPNVVRVDVPKGSKFTVCGDVHGQFFDLLNIFELNGMVSEENPYLFNGDFVDRGSWSAEVIFTLFALKCLYPRSLHLARGNHESKNMNKIYGFEGEIQAKYTQQMADVFREVFCWLPLGHIINEKAFVVHGGLFASDDVTIPDLQSFDRNREPPDEGYMCEMLWSDPQEPLGRAPSKRGVAIQFGPDVTKAFLERNNLDLVIRSHEVKDEGYTVEHDGFLVTVFSAPNYCDHMGNKGAFITFSGEDFKMNFTKFSAVEHPDIKPMAYANNYLFGG